MITKTPKEKAFELFNNCYIETDGFAKYNAKKFAALAVDEILNVCDFHKLIAEKDYWLNVKIEIGNQ
jgi:hypothetical protein